MVFGITWKGISMYLSFLRSLPTFQNIVIHYSNLDVLTCKLIAFCSSEAVAFVRDQLRQHGDVQVFSLSVLKTQKSLCSFCNWFCNFSYCYLVCAVGLWGTWSESSGMMLSTFIFSAVLPFISHKANLSTVWCLFQNLKHRSNFFLLS